VVITPELAFMGFVVLYLVVINLGYLGQKMRRRQR